MLNNAGGRFGGGKGTGKISEMNSWTFFWISPQNTQPRAFGKATHIHTHTPSSGAFGSVLKREKKKTGERFSFADIFNLRQKNIDELFANAVFYFFFHYLRQTVPTFECVYSLELGHFFFLNLVKRSKIRNESVYAEVNKKWRLIRM